MVDPVESSFGAKDVPILVEVAIEPDMRPAGLCIGLLATFAFAGLNRFRALSAAFG